MCVFCFFFKQKTAYEMRISDWSSDVCSSDLVSPIEILKTNRHYSKIVAELAWLGGRADSVQAAALCAAWFPAIEPMFFERLQQAIAGDALWPRVVLGWRLAWRLRHLRRIGRLRATASRCRRLLLFVTGRLQGPRDLALQTGGPASRQEERRGGKK